MLSCDTLFLLAWSCETDCWRDFGAHAGGGWISMGMERGMVLGSARWRWEEGDVEICARLVALWLLWVCDRAR